MDSIGNPMDKGIYNFFRRKGRKGVSLIHAPSLTVNLLVSSPTSHKIDNFSCKSLRKYGIVLQWLVVKVRGLCDIS
jgi:hypothetical protein